MDDAVEVGVLDAEGGENLPALRETQAIDRSQIGGILRPVAKPEEMLQAQEETRNMVATILKEGRDYMTIPGTNKPSLVKPGAERTNAAFGCMATFEIIEKEVDHDRLNQYVKRSWEWHPEIRGKKVWTEEAGESLGLYRYVIGCELVHRASGLVIGSGVGSCSTMEAKYIDRPRDLENTVLKMGKKRAYIDATLTAFGLSEQFTQDMEDMPREHFGGGEDEEWTLDSPAVGKKHKGKTWREVCAADPSYVSWAIGRQDNFEGMDSLDKGKRKALSDELDRLATIEDAGSQAGASEPPPPVSYSQEEIEGFLETLKRKGPDTGKNAGKKWFTIYSDDLEYFKNTLTHGWGARFREDVEVLGALRWAVAGGIERLKLEGVPIEEDGPPASQLFVDMVSGCDATALDAFAEVHPDLPSDMNDWDEEHYQTAVDAFRAVEEQGGARYATDKALGILRAKEEAAEGGPEPIPDEDVEKANAVLEKALSVGLETAEYEGQLAAKVREFDLIGYRLVVDEIRQAYFRKAAGKAP
jgi:hypothetical protein